MVGTGVPPITTTMELVAHGPDQTDLVWRMAPPRSEKDQRALAAMEDHLREVLMHDGAVLAELAVADARERAAGRAAEPDVPASAARNLSEPLPTAGGSTTYESDDSTMPDDSVRTDSSED
jgi:hypothetical protein